MKQDNVKRQIGEEIYKSMYDLGAPEELLAIVGSYGDTLDDPEILNLLQDWNKRRQYLSSMSEHTRAKPA